MKHILYLHIILLIVSLLVVSPNVFSGINDSSTFVLDFKQTAEDAQYATQVDSTPEFQQVDVNGETRTRFTATVVLKNATGLLGANCDLVFQNTKIRVVKISEAQGDLNFDGRANIADILTLAERYGQSTTSNGLSYFDRSPVKDNTIDDRDIEAVKPFINEKTLYWTSNPNDDLNAIRESVEIFESPEISNQNSKIDDIVSVLLPRIHPTPAGFGFTGDARIATITFEVVPGATGTTTIAFEDMMAIDESTEITQTQIINGSTPKTQNVEIILP